MTLRLSALLIIISTLKLSLEALVLPRPPPSPNEINGMQFDNNNNNEKNDRNKMMFDQKLYNDKFVYRQNGRITNVEKPNTDNYKLLEIEFRDMGKLEELRRTKRGGAEIVSVEEDANFEKILRQVLRGEELQPTKNIIGYLDKNNANKNGKIIDSSLSNYRHEDRYSDKSSAVLPNEKLYYLKHGSSKIMNVDITRKKTSWEPRSYLKSIGVYDKNNLTDDMEKKIYSTKSFYRPKKYRRDKNENDYGYEVEKGIQNFGGEVFTRHNEQKISNDYTTENSLPTSSELPKQIPPPPSRVPSQIIFTHTTPVLKFMSRRTDILPNGYVD